MPSTNCHSCGSRYPVPCVEPIPSPPSCGVTPEYIESLINALRAELLAAIGLHPERIDDALERLIHDRVEAAAAGIYAEVDRRLDEHEASDAAVRDAALEAASAARALAAVAERMPVVSLSGTSAMLEPGKCYSLDMSTDFAVYMQSPGGRPLNWIDGDVHDTYDADAGTVTRRVGVYTFTGAEPVFHGGSFIPSVGVYAYYIPFPMAPMKSGTALPGRCDRFQVYRGEWASIADPRPLVRFGQGNDAMYLLTDEQLSLDGLHELTRGMTVMYPLAEPYEEPAGAQLYYGEALLFVTPHDRTLQFEEDVRIDADMTNGSMYRLLVSWTPAGVLVEQTGEWLEQ